MFDFRCRFLQFAQKTCRDPLDFLGILLEKEVANGVDGCWVFKMVLIGSAKEIPK